MTTLEQSFGLPSLNDIEKIKQALHDQNTKIEQQGKELDTYGTELDESVQSAVSIINEREQRVLDIIDLKEYDSDVDVVYKESMEAFRDIMILCNDAPAPSAGKMYEAAANFAKIALDSKNSKMKMRLDAIDMAFKKQKMENVDKKVNSDVDGIKPVGAVVMDRNELLKSIKEELKNNS